MLSVLIVEDDITFSLMLTTWLGKKGFEVKALSSVSDAKRQIESVSYDLILSDLRLPDGDGIDLLKWVKEKYASLPLIMMTSYAEIQTAVQAIKLGASDYIAKPLNPEELLSKIREVVKTPAVGHTSAKKSPEGNTYIEGQSPAARQLFDHVRLRSLHLYRSASLYVPAKHEEVVPVLRRSGYRSHPEKSFLREQPQKHRSYCLSPQ